MATFDANSTILDYISVLPQPSVALLVPHSDYLAVDHCSLRCLSRQIFTNDQSESTLHQRDRSFASLAIHVLSGQISIRFTNQLHPRTGKLPSHADLRFASSVCILLFMKW